MSYTNTGLIEHCKKLYSIKDSICYIRGGLGSLMTASLIEYKCSQAYGVGEWNLPRKERYLALINKGIYGFDCTGLIKSYLFNWNNGTYIYNSSKDYNETMFYSSAKNKGEIGTLPRSVPGIAVIMPDHIGVSDGKGNVYEVTSDARFATQPHGLGGICITKLSDRKWTHWCEISFIDYYKNVPPTGCFDNAKSNYNGNITVSGWMFDKNQNSKSIAGKVLIDGTYKCSFAADKTRDDVNAAYGITGKHGFAVSIDGVSKGKHKVEILALDIEDSNIYSNLGAKYVEVDNILEVGSHIKIKKGYRDPYTNEGYGYPNGYEVEIVRIIPKCDTAEVLHPYQVSFADKKERFISEEDIIG